MISANLHNGFIGTGMAIDVIIRNRYMHLECSSCVGAGYPFVFLNNMGLIGNENSGFYPRFGGLWDVNFNLFICVTFQIAKG